MAFNATASGVGGSGMPPPAPSANNLIHIVTSSGLAPPHQLLPPRGSHHARGAPQFGGRKHRHEDEELGKLFVGGLSWDTAQESLLRYFSRFGEVIDCVVMKNAETGRSRGFGFVTFSDPLNVDAVLASCPHTLDGRTIDPKACNPRSLQKPKRSNFFPKIFLGGLPSSVTETDLRNFFSAYGEVCEVVIMYDQERKKSRGFGFLSFADEAACSKVVAEHFVFIQNKQVEIKRAEPRTVMGNSGDNRNSWTSSSPSALTNGHHPPPASGLAQPAVPPPLPTAHLPLNNYYGWNGGTSSAAPNVAGASTSTAPLPPTHHHPPTQYPSQYVTGYPTIATPSNNTPVWGQPPPSAAIIPATALNTAATATSPHGATQWGGTTSQVWPKPGQTYTSPPPPATVTPAHYVYPPPTTPQLQSYWTPQPAIVPPPPPTPSGAIHSQEPFAVTQSPLQVMPSAIPKATYGVPAAQPGLYSINTQYQPVAESPVAATGGSPAILGVQPAPGKHHPGIEFYQPSANPVVAAVPVTAFHPPPPTVSEVSGGGLGPQRGSMYTQPSQVQGYHPYRRS